MTDDTRKDNWRTWGKFGPLVPSQQNLSWVKAGKGYLPSDDDPNRWAQHCDPDKPISKCARTKAQNFVWMVFDPAETPEHLRGQKPVNRLKLLVDEIKTLISFTEKDSPYFKKMSPYLEDVCYVIDDELASLKRSFRHGRPWRYNEDAVFTDDDPLNEENTAFRLLEDQVAKISFQFDQLRNCAEQERNAYTVEGLLRIYSTLDRYIDEFFRNVKREVNLAVKGHLPSRD